MELLFWGFGIILEFLTQTKEFQGWGWDKEHLPITIGFLGTSFFAFLGAWALLKQNKKIWTDRSGKSVSMVWSSVFAFMFTAFFIYGLNTYSLACIVHGIFRAPFYIPIIIGLYRFKKVSLKENCLIVVMIITIILMMFSSQKIITLIFLIFTFAGVVALAFQPWEIYKEKSPGEVSLKLLIVYTTSMIFWMIYGYVIKDNLLFLMMVIYFLIYVLSLYLWWYYWKKERLIYSQQT